MTDKHKNLHLSDILEDIDKDAKNGKINLGDIVARLNSRGFGPLLAGTGLIAVLPTGAIPGVSTLLCVLIILITAQILMGRSSPWIPERLKQISFSAGGIKKIKDKMMPFVKKLDGYVKPRYAFMTSSFIAKIVALLCIPIALSMPFMGLIPFALLIPGLAIVLLGLGLAIHDGILMMIAFAVTLGGAGFMVGIF